MGSGHGLVVAIIPLTLLWTTGYSAPLQQASIMGGAVSAESAKSYSWAVEYRQGLGKHAAISFARLNEGHFDRHRRDGQTVQLWVGTHMPNRRLWLTAGIGPYFFFDTARAVPGASYENDHGWATVASVDATWYALNGWLYQLRVNRITGDGHFDSTGVLIGVGHRLSGVDHADESARIVVRKVGIADNEVTLLLGGTIVNSYESERGVAKSLEYRRRIAHHVDWTLAWLEEGDARLVRRNGVLTKLWLVGDFFGNRLTLGAGFGPYFTVDRYHSPAPNEAEPEAVSEVLSISVGLRFSDRWLTRASWSRVVTEYSRDTDVLLLGLGYRF